MTYFISSATWKSKSVEDDELASFYLSLLLKYEFDFITDFELCCSLQWQPIEKKTIQCCQNWIMNKKVLDNLLQKDSFTTVNSFVVFFNKMFYSIFVTSLQTWKEILISTVTTTINLSKTQWRTNGIYPENHLSIIKKILSKNTSNIAHDLNNFSQRKNKINGISHLKFYCVSHVM